MSLSRFRLAGLCILALAGTAAQAAEFDGPYPPRGDYGGDFRRTPHPEPAFRRPHFTAAPEFGPPERCRAFVRRRIDAYGEEVIRRVRVCDEPGFDGPRHRPAFLEGRLPAWLPDRGDWDDHGW